MAKTVKPSTLTEQVLQKAGKRGKKGSHKAGRNKVKCTAYLASGRREVNKAIKLMRHLRKYADDAAYAVFKELPQTAKDVAKKLVIAHRDRCVMGEVLAAKRLAIQAGG